MTKTKPSPKQKKQPAAWWSNRKYVAMILFGIAVILYLNTLSHGFVLDDSLVITKNHFTTKGVSGIGDIFSHDTFRGYYGKDADQLNIVGGRYRPLSVAIFAFLYQLFGASAAAFHLWNVLLYGMCCAFLYLVLRRIFDSVRGTTTSVIFCAGAALLYTVHPIHTEVVNNIKSNDEILSMLLSLASLYLAVRYVQTGITSRAWMSGIALFLATLAKENAIVFLAIIPLTIWMLPAATLAKNRNLKLVWIAVGAAFLLYMLVRTSVIGWSFGPAPLDLINNPFIKIEGGQWVHCTIGEKWAMAFWSLGKYLQLLFFPVILSSDYYPRYVDVITFANPIALISLLAHLALAGRVIYSIVKNEKSILWYGIGFYLVSVSIVSNLVFPIGTNLAERYLFMPSAGFAIAITAILLKLFQTSSFFQKSGIALAGILMILLAMRTFIRNPDFASNKILFAKDITASPESAKIQNGYGAILAEEALQEQDQAKRQSMAGQALPFLDRAIDLHPTYLEAFYMRGNVHFMMGAFDKAIEDYRSCLRINPDYAAAVPNYALALREHARYLLDTGGDRQLAITLLEESKQLYPNEAETDRLLQLARG